MQGSPYVIRPAYGVTRPRRRVIGQDLAGTAERVGAKVTRFSVQAWRPDDLLTLGAWIETGIVSPVIERTYPLSETPAAVTYVGQGHARGKAVITV